MSLRNRGTPTRAYRRKREVIAHVVERAGAGRRSPHRGSLLTDQGPIIRILFKQLRVPLRQYIQAMLHDI